MITEVRHMARAGSTGRKTLLGQIDRKHQVDQTHKRAEQTFVPTNNTENYFPIISPVMAFPWDLRKLWYSRSMVLLLRWAVPIQPEDAFRVVSLFFLSQYSYLKYYINCLSKTATAQIFIYFLIYIFLTKTLRKHNADKMWEHCTMVTSELKKTEGKIRQYNFKDAMPWCPYEKTTI